MALQERKNSYFSMKYQEIISRGINEQAINEVIELKNECKINNNLYYFYLFDVILADIYIDKGNLDSALELMLKDYNELESSMFTDVHIMILERIIYVYITKQYYPSALRYAQEKRNYFINPTNDVVNRWYLEMAYIHEALGERNRSLTELNAILENNPDDSTRIIALNNIIKLFIEDGNITEALLHHGECFALCVKNGDKEGEDYCNYLRAKIYRLQKHYKKAIPIFEKIFKRITNLEEDNFNYLNEYISLLIETEDYNKARKLCEKFMNLVTTNEDLYNKKIFYDCYLKVNIYLLTNKKVKKEKIANLFTLLEDLEKEITINKDLKSNEVRDVELTFEVKNKSQSSNESLKELLNLLYGINTTDLGEILDIYSNTVERICRVSDISYYIFDRNDEQIVPNYIVNGQTIEAYSYKHGIVHRRNVDYQDLNNSVIEMLFTGHNNIVIDFEDTPTDLIDPMTKLKYRDMRVRYLIATPLFENNKLYGAVVYASKSVEISSNLNSLLLKTATIILEKSLINNFKYENITTQKELMIDGLELNDVYMMSYNVFEDKIYLPDYYKNIIGLENNVIDAEEYEKFIETIDLDCYKQKYSFINEKKEYSITYHLNINGEILHVNEKCKPSKNGDYYFGSLCEVEAKKAITIDNEKVYVLEDLLKEVVNLKEKSKTEGFKFYTCVWRIKFNDFISLNEKTKVIKEVYTIIQHNCCGDVYLLDDLFVIVSENEISDFILKIKNELNKNFVLNEKVIKPIFSHFVMNYPDNIIKIDDLVELIYFINDYFIKNNDSEELNNDVYARFIAYRTVNECALKAINNDSIKLIFTKLVNNSKTVGYLAVPNIEGINSTEHLNILSRRLKVKLDEKQILTVLEKNIDNVYLSVSMRAIKNLIASYNEEKLNKISVNFILEDFTSDYVDVIKKIKSLGHNIIVSGDDLYKLTSELIFNHHIAGVYNVNDENQKYFDCLKDNVYLLTANVKETFPNTTLITKEVVNLTTNK